ncbi:hypothetical protein AAVH_38252 [Aphelenchoides avenae]|nr:hypothetical protein AAVH_38252 [Aphelenchus avenae]
MAPPSKDQETDWEPIINAVQPHEFLYNPQLPDYMDRDKKKRTWAEIGKTLVPECDGDAAYVQWKRIKDQYDKKKREAAKKKSGSAADDYLKKWAWSAHMSFLDKVRIVAQPQTSLAQQQPQASGSATQGSTSETSQSGLVLSQFPPSPAVGRKRSGRRDDDTVQDLAKKVLLNLNAKLEQCGPKASKSAFAELMVARLDDLEKLTSGTFREYAEGRLLHVLAEIKAEAVSGQHGPFQVVSDAPSTVDNEVQILPPTQQPTGVTNFIPATNTTNVPVYKQCVSSMAHPSMMDALSPDSTENDTSAFSAEFDDGGSASDSNTRTFLNIQLCSSHFLCCIQLLVAQT